MKKIALWTLTLGWASYTFYLTTIPNFQPSPDTFISWLLANGGHFVFFGVLAALLYISISATSHIRHTTPYALAISSLYGLLIEFLQMRIPGRTADPVDWILDTLGALLFLWLVKKVTHRKV